MWAAFKERHDEGGRYLLEHAVQFRSSVRYTSDWRRWCKFITQYVRRAGEPDLYLLQKGSDFEQIDMREQVKTVIAYMHYAVSVLGLKAGTITGSLSGVRHWFRKNALSLAVFTHPAVTSAKTALSLEQRKQESLKELSVMDSGKRKLPFTVEMVYRVTLSASSLSGIMESQMIATAVQLAFFGLLRVSEYVPDYKGEEEHCCHALKASDVFFELVVENGKHLMVEASKATRDMWSRVQLVKFILRHSKNDKKRIGSVFWFRNQVGHSGINIVRSVFNWVIVSRPTSHSYLMSYRTLAGHDVWLRYGQVSAVVKHCAKCFGFNPKHFGTHSLRVGGACTLRAGAAPVDGIKALGRWGSLECCLGYQETSLRELDTMQSILRDPTVFTVRDVWLIHSRSGLE